MFNVAEFLNLQASGLTVKQLNEDTNLRKIVKPVATYDVFHEDENEDEFIAIAEGIEIPIYLFTY